MVYTAATTEADHMTTLLQNDARQGLELLSQALKSISGSGQVLQITEQLHRLYTEHNDKLAGDLLAHYCGLLGALGNQATVSAARIQELVEF